MERHPGIRREGFGVRSCSTAIGCIPRMENDKRRVKLYQPVVFILGVHVSSWGLQPHEVDGSEGTKERGSEGNVFMGLACK